MTALNSFDHIILPSVGYFSDHNVNALYTGLKANLMLIFSRSFTDQEALYSIQRYAYTMYRRRQSYLNCRTDISFDVDIHFSRINLLNLYFLYSVFLPCASYPKRINQFHSGNSSAATPSLRIYRPLILVTFEIYSRAYTV